MATFWEGDAHSVDHMFTCILTICYLSYFPFRFEGWLFGSDCSSSWSFIQTTCVYPYLAKKWYIPHVSIIFHDSYLNGYLRVSISSLSLSLSLSLSDNCVKLSTVLICICLPSHSFLSLQQPTLKQQIWNFKTRKVLF